MRIRWRIPHVHVTTRQWIVFVMALGTIVWGALAAVSLYALVW